jgi:uncharacterized protein YqeY
MSLKEQILEDMKTAMRAKNASQLESIRLLRAAIQRKEVDDRVELDDDEVLAILQKQIKQSQDAISQFAAGDRPDLVQKEQIHVDHLKVYLPEQMSDDDVGAAVTAAIASTGAGVTHVVVRLVVPNPPHANEGLCLPHQPSTSPMIVRPAHPTCYG